MKVMILQAPKQLEQVIALGKRNKKTLGFFPLGAYSDAVREKRVLIAVEKDQVIGYLLYRKNQKNALVSIVHLCVEETKRGAGVTRALFNELKDITKSTYRAVRVCCRRDYPANSLWPKLGFVPLAEKSGRGKTPMPLNVWDYDYRHPNLFSSAVGNSKKILVSMDANIFFDLQSARHEESSLLTSEWLEDDVQLAVTDEIYNEIERQKDEALRKKSRVYAGAFEVVKAEIQEHQSKLTELKAMFPTAASPQDVSDLSHLAKSISGDCKIFLTRDDDLLKNAEAVYQKFGIEVLRPSHFIRRQHELLRSTDYQPARLASAHLRIKRLQTVQISAVIDAFLASGERKREFETELNVMLARPLEYEINLVEDKQPRMLAVYSCKEESLYGTLDVPLIRVSKGMLQSTIEHCLIRKIVTTALQKKTCLIRVTEKKLSDTMQDALKRCGFHLSRKGWVKFIIRSVCSIREFQKKMAELEAFYGEYKDFFESIADVVKNLKPDQQLIGTELEKMFWPLKIADIKLPAFIVPIKPNWAMNLFEEGLAGDDLFGSDPSLFFNFENVYYRASKPSILTSPSRVLWYVSGMKSHKRTMCVGAASSIEEVLIDKPKILYARFKRLGIYEWKDVYAVAKEKTDNDIMAFRFSGTELFSFPIALGKLREIWKEKKGRQFNVTSPLEISSELYFHIYTLGTEGTA